MGVMNDTQYSAGGPILKHRLGFNEVDKFGASKVLVGLWGLFEVELELGGIGKILTHCNWVRGAKAAALREQRTLKRPDF